jgi:hypothetical protein
MPHATKKCAVCSAEFQPLSPRQLYCSTACRPSSWKPETTNNRPRIGKLDSIGGVAHELNKLYRRVALGHTDSAIGARMAGILGILRQTLEVGAMEQRLELIESTILHLATGKGTPILLRSKDDGGSEQTH